MKELYKIKSPAKINIGLRILSKREDGYHNIETIFYPVKIFDEIKLTIKKINDKNQKSKIAVTTNSNLKIEDENNICCKAAELFIESYKIKEPYNIVISIKKNIPIGAGLGGGSSDAASVLKILGRHFKFDIDVDFLLPIIAAKLGSDVPFFLKSVPAYGDLRGERLRFLPDFKIPFKILIVNPGINVSTKWAYESMHKSGFRFRLRKKLNMIKTFDPDHTGIFKNSFENAVFKKYSKIGKIKEKMTETNALLSLMSGSGSSVFGLYKKEADLKSALKYFKKTNYKIFTV